MSSRGRSAAAHRKARQGRVERRVDRLNTDVEFLRDLRGALAGEVPEHLRGIGARPKEVKRLRKRLADRGDRVERDRAAMLHRLRIRRDEPEDVRAVEVEICATDVSAPPVTAVRAVAARGVAIAQVARQQRRKQNFEEVREGPDVVARTVAHLHDPAVQNLDSADDHAARFGRLGAMRHELVEHTAVDMFCRELDQPADRLPAVVPAAPAR